MPSEFIAFGRWLEQLIAESTGKEGQGIVPVLEPLPISPEAYSRDRIFVTFSLQGENEPFWLKRLEYVEKSGLPCIHLNISPRDLAEDFFIWEIATAIAGYFLKINPFDQPDVELTKKKTREILDQPESTNLEGYLSSENSQEIEQALKTLLLDRDKPSGYISVLAFLPSDDNLNSALDNLARQITEKPISPVPGIMVRLIFILRVNSIRETLVWGVSLAFFMMIIGNCLFQPNQTGRPLLLLLIACSGPRLWAIWLPFNPNRGRFYF